ncbi:hypothetical protein B0H14DRAFT_2568496 [Mycena olivaceomarginata]|nr:hypothetical protein B0H14DRAFT_2568496 [Mycena olivaceomarginata]
METSVTSGLTKRQSCSEPVRRYRQYVQNDIGFKRVIGFYEFELAGWDRDGHTTVVFCRIFLDRQTAIAHQRIFEAIQEIVYEDTGLRLQWRHIHGKSADDYEGVKEVKPGSQARPKIRRASTGRSLRFTRQIASASSPGGSQGSLPLKRRQVISLRPARLVDEHAVDVLAMSEEAQLDSLSPGTEQPEIAVGVDINHHATYQPINPAQISKIPDVIEIGDDLTEEERIQVQSTVWEYAGYARLASPVNVVQAV